DAPALLTSVLTKWMAATTCADWLFCDALRRHPKLRIALSEGGITWLPAVLGAAEYVVDRYWFHSLFRRDPSAFVGYAPREGPVDGWPHGDATPLEIYRKHIRACFVGGLAGEADVTRSVIERYGPDV